VENDRYTAAKEVASRCFEAGLVIERVGRNDTVLKILLPFVSEMDLLKQRCAIIKQSINECLSSL
jgi:diaminobutyrate-2-oxoglutarate transaminase